MPDSAREIREGKCRLGIEFGSTRIKAVLIGEDRTPVASGSHDWENRWEDGIWTYSLDDIHSGLVSCFASLKADVEEKFGVRLTKLSALGVSAMMHGLIAFDSGGKLLSPFRTWRNTITAAESAELTAALGRAFPQRWTACHLLKAIKEESPWLEDLASVNTLAGYVHWKLTDRRVLGVGDASGMFPVAGASRRWDDEAADTFDSLYLKGRKWGIRDLLPEILLAGDSAGTLTEEGALMLDPTGDLEPGSPLCPPEGDAGTGMVATNSVRERAGNVSAGTSAFAMVVLEKPLSRPRSELDIVATPDGSPVAMAHTNNCTGSYDSWLSLFGEVLSEFGCEVKKGEFYDKLLMKALEGEADAGGLVSYNYISGEPIAGLDEAMPVLLRPRGSMLNLANFMRSELISAVAAMRCGLDILFDEEGAGIDLMSGHGGYFKTREAGQRMMSAALGVPVRVLSGAGEGGAWGMALLADYLLTGNGMPLADHLDEMVFKDAEATTVDATPEEKAGFGEYFRRYRAGAAAVKAAVGALGGTN